MITDPPRTVWQDLEEFSPDPLGDNRRDYHAWWVFYNDTTIRIAPASEKTPPGYFSHYKIEGMVPAGLMLVFRGDTREQISRAAVKKAEMYRGHDAEHEAFVAARKAGGTWNPTLKTNRPA